MIFFLGQISPPVTGMSTITEKLRDQLLMRTARVKVFNTVPSRLSVFFPGRKFVVCRACYLFLMFFPYVALVIYHRPKVLYFSISGQLGQILELPYMVVAGIFCQRIYIHHHTYQHLKFPSRWTRAIFAAARQKDVHIGLCIHMAEQIELNYGITRHRVLSNAAFFDPIPLEQKVDCRTLGFLGNLFFEKGIREFVDTFRLACKRNQRLRGLIAGPIMSQEVESYLTSQLNDIQELQYLGPVYGERKRQFLKDIDILVFPSQLEEAEPVTIYEAFQTGSPAIAIRKGCIASMIECGAGVAIDAKIDFAGNADQYLRLLDENDVAYREASAAASAGFRKHSATQKLALDQLLDEWMAFL